MRRFRGQKAERGGALKLGLKALKKSRCIQSGTRVRTPDLTHDRTVLSRFGQRGQLLESHQKFCVHDHLSLKYCSEVAVPTTATVLRTRRFPAVLETHGERQSLPDRVSVRAESCPNTRLSIPERFSSLPHLVHVAPHSHDVAELSRYRSVVSASAEEKTDGLSPQLSPLPPPLPIYNCGRPGGSVRRRLVVGSHGVACSAGSKS